MKKKTNRESVVQFIILVLTAILLTYGLMSGKINKFVHPRFYVGLWMSIIVLLWFAVSVLLDRKKGRHNLNLQQYSIYLIPLIFVMLFPPTGTGNADMALADSTNSVNANENYSQSEIAGSVEQSSNQLENSQEEEQSSNTYSKDGYDSRTTSEDTEYSDANEYLQDDQDSNEGEKEADVSESYHTNEVNGSYVISDDAFADWLFDLYDHLDDFAGEKYQFLAQVYSMDGLEENQFLAGRYFMVCCAADLAGYGIICDSDIRSELVEDQWITVTATISKREYEGSEVPILKDAVITEAEAPEVEYIYYNY